MMFLKGISCISIINKNFFFIEQYYSSQIILHHYDNHENIKFMMLFYRIYRQKYKWLYIQINR